MRHLIALCAIAVLLTACDDKKSKKVRSKPSETTEVATNGPPEETPPAEDQPNDKADRSTAEQPKSRMKLVPDNSLTIQEYRKLKMPDPAGTWQTPQYRYAAEALAKIAEDDISKLPRANSPRSGKLFARLVAPDNLNILRSRKLSLEDRARHIEEFGDPLLAITDVYVDAMNAGNQFDVEVVQLGIFSWDALEAIIAIVDQAVAEFSTQAGEEIEKPDEEFWQEVLPHLTREFADTLGMLEDQQLVRPPQRVQLAKGIQKYWPGFLDRISESTRNELQTRMAKIVETEQDPQVKQALKKTAEYRKAEQKKR